MRRKWDSQKIEMSYLKDSDNIAIPESADSNINSPDYKKLIYK